MSNTDKVMNKMRTLAELATEQGWKLHSAAFRSVDGSATAQVAFVDKTGRKIYFQV